MIEIRKSEQRGYAQHGWLESYHSFSFADYYDPRFMGFRDLRVMNEDRIKPGKGFGTHGHRDMEIVTYVLDGSLQHKDSTGVRSILGPGDVQRMSAGTGVEHSEFNHSSENFLHLLQIWILPLERGLPPSHEEKNFPLEERKNNLRLIVSPDGRNQSLKIHQDVFLYAAVLEQNVSLEVSLAPERYGWIQVARGELRLNGHLLRVGDGASISKETKLQMMTQSSHAEFLFFDLA